MDFRRRLTFFFGHIFRISGREKKGDTCTETMCYYFRKGNKLACHGSHTFISRWQDFPITPRSPKKVGRRQRHRPRPKIAGRNEEKRKGKIGEIVGRRRRCCKKRERGRKNFVHSSQFVSVHSVPGNGKNSRGEERIGRQREEISFKK